MKIGNLSTALFAAVLGIYGVSTQVWAASTPEAVVITEADITDRPYRIIGDISLTVKKVGIVDRPPIEVKVDNALRAKAVEMGADAVILVRYERHGFTGLSLGRIDATGRAVAFTGGPGSAARPAAPAPAPQPATAQPSVAQPPAAPVASSAADPNGFAATKARSYMEAVNGGNIAAAVQLFADNATLEDPVGAQVQQGKAAIEAYVRGLIARGTKFELVLPARTAPNTAVLALRARSSAGVQSAVMIFTLSGNGMIASLKSYGGAE